MLTVAVTGGIGAGKSTAAAALARCGALVVDSDRLAREVLAPGTAGLRAVVEAFGSEVLHAHGALDRAAMAAIVFADPRRRRLLESITHPLVRARFAEIRRQAPEDAIVVNDIPLLTTVAAAAEFQLVIGVGADLEGRVSRLGARGLSEDDARARIAAQLDDVRRRALCDAWVVNDGSPSELSAAVERLWANRLRPFGEHILAGTAAPRSRPVLVAPDPAWPARARLLAARVSAAAGGARVDHIGPTAVPGVSAAAVIALQLTVPDPAGADSLAPALAAAGFVPVPLGCGVEPNLAGVDPCRSVERMHVNSDPGQDVNLYLRVKDSPNWRMALLVSDWLRADAGVRADYRRVTIADARRHVDDPDTGGSSGDPDAGGYPAAEASWFALNHRAAKAWAAASGWTPDRRPGPVVGPAA